jgi:hypothetical protein
MKDHKLRSKKVRLALAAVVLVACLVMVTGVALAIANPYTLNWNVIAGGGGQGSTGGKYSLSGTIGQGEVYQSMTGSGGYSLTGGFWTGMPSTLVYFPRVKK